MIALIEIQKKIKQDSDNLYKEIRSLHDYGVREWEYNTVEGFDLLQKSKINEQTFEDFLYSKGFVRESEESDYDGGSTWITFKKKGIDFHFEFRAWPGREGNSVCLVDNKIEFSDLSRKV